MARLKAGHCVCGYALSSNGLPTNGYGKSSIEYGQCLIYTCIQSASQQAGTANRALNMASAWLTLFVPIGLPTDGY